MFQYVINYSYPAAAQFHSEVCAKNTHKNNSLNKYAIP